MNPRPSRGRGSGSGGVPVTEPTRHLSHTGPALVGYPSCPRCRAALQAVRDLSRELDADPGSVATRAALVRALTTIPEHDRDCPRDNDSTPPGEPDGVPTTPNNHRKDTAE